MIGTTSDPRLTMIDDNCHSSMIDVAGYMLRQSRRAPVRKLHHMDAWWICAWELPCSASRLSWRFWNTHTPSSFKPTFRASPIRRRYERLVAIPSKGKREV